MSKKNSIVNLKNNFKDFNDLRIIYLDFKKKLKILKQEKLIIAVSGGPDSLALAALAKSFSYEHKTKIYYVLINHNIRKNSGKEALQVKNLLKTKKLN